MSTPFDPYRPPQASLDEPPQLDPSAAVPPVLIQLMAQTRPWVRLFSVLSFIGLGLTFLAIIFLGTNSRYAPPGMNAGMLIPSLVVLLLCIPPALFLWQYASGIRRLQDGGGMPAFEEALTRQKSYWKYLGIMVTILLGLYGLLLGSALVFGAFLRR
jgi:hypothetical protein